MMHVPAHLIAAAFPGLSLAQHQTKNMFLEDWLKKMSELSLDGRSVSLV